ncbi:ATP-binding cassette domain-containing protein, partial [Staphylococcus sp. GSSP0090]|nr:ATP-binding cassette domain-containing protein [Staphylococcus sp. GSSP0090]
MTNILEITNLSIADRFGNMLIHHVSLGLKKSKVNVLIGESGSGKSLTAKAMVQQVPKTLDMQYDRMTYEHYAISDMHALLGKEIG